MAANHAAITKVDMSCGVSKSLKRELLLERGAKCENCGATLEELKQKFPNCNNQLQVAHIKSKRAYPELANVKSNLKLLCQKCHEESDPIQERFLRAGRLLRRM